MNTESSAAPGTATSVTDARPAAAVTSAGATADGAAGPPTPGHRTDPQALQSPQVPAAAQDRGASRRAERLATPRLTRELNTMGAMLRIFCRDHHAQDARGPDRLCAECSNLFAYARKRLAGCPYGPAKPTCANCQIHCYGPVQREQARVMMRYAGPRMLLLHPWLALAHLIDGKRAAPPKPSNTSGVRDAARRTCTRSD